MVLVLKEASSFLLFSLMYIIFIFHFRHYYCIASSGKIYSSFTTEGNFCVQFDKPLCATRHTAGKMFPRIAKRIIYHASRHLFRTFKMLLQYLELQIIHVRVIRRVKIQQMGGSTINFQTCLSRIYPE